MSRIIILLLFHLLTLTGIGQGFLSFKDGNLKGKIKSIESYQYYIINKNGEIQKGKRDYGSKKFFNEEGLIQKEINYPKTSVNSPSETFYYYDTLGRLEKRTTPNEYGQWAIYYTYDNGQIITKTGTSVIRTIPNALGYDSIVTATSESAKGINVTRSEYDSHGYPTKETDIAYELDGVTQKQINWIQSYTNKYDKNDNLIETDIFKEVYHSESWYITIYYDGINFGTREAKKYEKSGSLNCTITYNKYDKNMNWTKMIKYYNGVAHCIVERIITYY